MDSEWTCSSCGETFDPKVTSAGHHYCLVARESREFDKAFPRFLDSPAGQFAIYYAQRLINASNPTNLPLAKS
jgi:hypothetical protein